MTDEKAARLADLELLLLGVRGMLAHYDEHGTLTPAEVEAVRALVWRASVHKQTRDTTGM